MSVGIEFQRVPVQDNKVCQFARFKRTFAAFFSAKLMQDAKVIDAMILSGMLSTDLGGGNYKVELSYYTGKLRFFPKPTLMLAQH